MKKQIILFLTGILIISCTNSPSYVAEVKKELKSIQSITDHKLFLHKIHNDSQVITEEIEALDGNFFLNRYKVRDLEKERDSLMRKNIYRVQQYLESYEYPSDKAFTDEERLAIYYAIFNSNLKKVLLRFLPELTQAHQDGLIDDFQYVGYLGRTHYISTRFFFTFDKRQSLEVMTMDIYSAVLKIKEENE